MATKKEQPKKESSQDEITYEAALAKLEETVTRLENGSLPLEDSLRAFDEGVGLIRLLSAKLDAMEQRMLVLTGTDGTATASLEET